jgi:hypothetical protein
MPWNARPTRRFSVQNRYRPSNHMPNARYSQSGRLVVERPGPERSEGDSIIGVVDIGLLADEAAMDDALASLGYRRAEPWCDLDIHGQPLDGVYAKAKRL